MADPRALLRRAGVEADPARDQYFLVDQRVLDRIPTYATEAGMDLSHVLEIGAGTGGLTARLLAVAERVTAIERDPDLGAFLEQEFAAAINSERLDVIVDDALEVAVPAHSAVIANLPYGISSPLLFRLLPENRPMVVMVQREFGERMAAAPGTDAYGRLSVTSQHYAEITVLETVPPSAFLPQPAVESAVVRTRPRKPAYEVSDPDLFMDCVRAMFTQRRKTARNAIRNTTHISGIDEPGAVVERLPLELLDARPDALEPADFARVARIAAEVE